MSYIQAINFNSRIENQKRNVVYVSSPEIFSAVEINNNKINHIDTNQQKTNSCKKNIKRTTLNDKEKIIYAKIYTSLDKKMRQKLERCLKSGKILDYQSNDNSSTLDNLYKILTTARTSEVNAKTILNECINIIDNPFIVTQVLEDIPEEYMDQAAEYVYSEENKERQQRKNIAKDLNYMREQILESGEDKLDKKQEIKKIKEKINNAESGTCVAASIEFAFATKYPAEFVRIIEGLSSERKEVKKFINCKKANLTNYEIDIFATPYIIKDGKKEFILRTDEGAYILANIQKLYQDNDERSTIDILFQSLVFQIASQGTYNSITDKHSSIYNKKGGLNINEEVYALKILTGRNIKDETYRIYHNKKLSESTNIKTVEQNIDNVLKQGNLVFIGVNCSDNKTIFTEGHEITIIGKQKLSDGKEYYVCKDSDEAGDKPLYKEKNKLLEKIINTCVIN